MMDFVRHNEEVRQVWQAYYSGKPLRVPMLLTSVPRIWVLDPSLNPSGVTWQQYLNDPQVMLNVCLEHQYYVSHFIPQDSEMGVPDQKWSIHLEFGNVAEESWFGCEIIYPDNQIATTLPRYVKDARGLLLERALPGPFDGFMGRAREFYEFAVDHARNLEFHGRPVSIRHPAVLGTDGPLTVANGICGTQIMEDIYGDNQYFHEVMGLVTDAIIARIRAWRVYLGLESRPRCGGFADDAVQFISTRTYREQVLPYHRRLMDALYGEGPHSIHLCGNAQRHFPTIVRELNVGSFDTGFPINFSTLRDEVGENVEIQGGVKVADLLNDTPDGIYAKTRDILQSGIMRGGRFILKEANDLAPCVPLENMRAMYRAARAVGVYGHQEGIRS
jgi:hypothetical protein